VHGSGSTWFGSYRVCLKGGRLRARGEVAAPDESDWPIVQVIKYPLGLRNSQSWVAVSTIFDRVRASSLQILRLKGRGNNWVFSVPTAQLPADSKSKGTSTNQPLLRSSHNCVVDRRGASEERKEALGRFLVDRFAEWKRRFASPAWLVGCEDIRGTRPSPIPFATRPRAGRQFPHP